MERKTFDVDALVWAKMKGYPPWPAKIARPLPNVKCPNVKKSHHFVWFFGSKNFAWIQDLNIFPHTEEMLIASQSYKKPSKQLLSAIEEIKEIASRGPVDKDSEEDAEPEKEETSPKTVTHKDKAAKEDKAPPSKDPDSPDESLPAKKKKKILKPKFKKPLPSARKLIKVRIPSKLRPTISDGSKRASSSLLSKTQKLKTKYAELFSNCPPNLGFSRVAVIRPYEDAAGSSSVLTRRDYFERPKTPPIDLTCLNEAEVGAQATKRIGFLGLGLMGRGIVKNLLRTGHKVTIWNRNPDKCNDFIQAGATTCTTPGDVASECDITFCCISDVIYCKEAVTGNCGVVKTLKSNFDVPINTKGYVVLTSLDPETSKEIATALQDIGVQYLEVPMIGDRKLADSGNLLLLASGDNDLYEECESCFSAMSKDIMYFGSDVGYASKLKLCHSMFQGSMIASLAECVALHERTMPAEEESSFYEILESTDFSNPMILEKLMSMQKRCFTTNTALRHQQRELSFAIDLSHETDLVAPIATAANELYKSAMLRGYSDHDVAAVLLGAKY